MKYLLVSIAMICAMIASGEALFPKTRGRVSIGRVRISWTHHQRLRGNDEGLKYINTDNDRRHEFEVTGAFTNVIVYRADDATCVENDTCPAVVYDLGTDYLEDADTANLDVVRYNWLVSESGTIYKGMGWEHQGSHSEGINQCSLGIAFIGNANGGDVSQEALEAADFLIRFGVREGKLIEAYKLYASCQIGEEVCEMEKDFIDDLVASTHFHENEPTCSEAPSSGNENP